MTASLCACRCLTDTLVQVPSGEGREELKTGDSRVCGSRCLAWSASI